MDTLQIILSGFFKGLKDSGLVPSRALNLFRRQDNANKKMEEKANLKGGTSNSYRKALEEEPNLRKRILQCCALNAGVFGVSIYFFNLVLLPAINFFIRVIFASSPFKAEETWSVTNPIITKIFTTVWVIPMFFICKLVNTFWCQDIAKTAFKYSSTRPQSKFDFSKVISDFFFTIIIQILFLFQGVLAVYLIPIPFLGFLINWINYSLLYALYAFEYKWFYEGWELHRRLYYIEEIWYYFVGFGFPLQFIMWLADDYFTSGCLYAVCFPLFLIGSFEAQPSQVQAHRNLRLRFFSPAICISNVCFPKRPTAIRRD